MSHASGLAEQLAPHPLKAARQISALADSSWCLRIVGSNARGFIVRQFQFEPLMVGQRERWHVIISTSEV